MLLLFAVNIHAQENISNPSSTTSETIISDDDDANRVKPRYPGGLEALYTFLNTKFRIPRVKEDIRAHIYVSFVIEKDGTMSSYKIIRDPGYGLAKEAIRVLKSIKERWIPGTINGLPVRCSYNLPITINIKD